ncbi:carbohydrate ABC transporter permease [Zhihengliuella flava]|uniref:Multiple sugar transport system permease protein n=1 Tax=Zhihengliuella flava TaxID=1285193 RepID=A0A931DCF4_9MICC|nr:sugar ABC transporter permease [Zhihengliuella flava]MBG6084976.1 multiple sugar transport system permease protein [Zhihengliuella flava]
MTPPTAATAPKTSQPPELPPTDPRGHTADSPAPRGATPAPRRQDGKAAAFLLSPTLIVLALVIFYPLLSAVGQSLYSSDAGLDDQGFVVQGDVFVGLQNYAQIFAGPESARFYNALWNTTFFTVVSVALETVIGVMFALMMNRAFKGRAFLRAAVLVPWAIPTAVSGLLWRWMFQTDGIVNTLSGAQVLWTAEGMAAQVAVITAEVWKTAPFIGLLVLAGLQIIPEEVYEAAKLDGATAWQQFWSITLPLVKPALLVAVLFRLLDALRMFDLPFVLIGPRKESVETLSILAWDSANQLEYGMASAFAVVLVVYVAAIVYVFVRLLGADIFTSSDAATPRKRFRRAAADDAVVPPARQPGARTTTHEVKQP